MIFREKGPKQALKVCGRCIRKDLKNICCLGLSRIETFMIYARMATNMTYIKIKHSEYILANPKFKKNISSEYLRDTWKGNKSNNSSVKYNTHPSPK